VLSAPRFKAAARWLNDNMSADYGWGYNEIVGSDADSTSYAILFLKSAGQQVPDAAYTLLVNFQRPDGGFSTYLPSGEPNSWNVSHPDVTPVALLAMLTHSVPDCGVIQRGIDYILQQKISLGLWNSFWWRSCLYGTAASLSLLEAEGIEMPLSTALIQVEPNNAFEAALLISCLLYEGRDASHDMIRDLVEDLISQQQPDGSWKTAPILRITRRDCYEPWASADAGQLYAEQNRLFTTATVLHALAKVHGGY
jgi:squalene cyclase